MKSLLILIVLGAVGWYVYQNRLADGPPAAIDNPVWGEMRVTSNVQSREIEMALFIRSASDDDCRTRAQVSWSSVLKSCPTCAFQPVKCQKQLPPRYARLFDDVPIPSTYLSATAGSRGERDGRLVIYGLTDAEGVVICEQMRGFMANQYKGTTRCIPASGG
jgi:hypothetical protein